MAQQQQKQKIVTCPKCQFRMAIPPGYENTPGKCPKCGGAVNQPVRAAAGTAAPQAPPRASQAPSPTPPGPPQAAQAPQGEVPGLGIPALAGASILDDGPIQLNNPLLDDEPVKLDPSLLGDSGADQPGGLGGLDALGLSDSIVGASPTGNIYKKEPHVETPEERRARLRKWLDPKLLMHCGLAFLMWGAIMAVVCILLLVGVFSWIGGGGEIKGEMETRTAVQSGVSMGILAGLLIGGIWGVVKTGKPSLLTATAMGAGVGFVLSGIHFGIEEFVFKLESDFTLMQMVCICTAAGAFFGVTSDRLRQHIEDEE